MDIQENTNITQPQIYCKCQFQETAQFINIQSLQEEEVFVCENCVAQENNSSRYMLINRILQNQNNGLFLFWPYLDDQGLTQQIRYLSSQQNFKNQKSEQIENFFNDFHEEICKVLNQLKKIIFNNQNNIFENTSNLLDYYKKISQLDDLKNIIIDNQSTKQQKSNQIQQLIAKKKEESTENTNKIKQLIEKINQFPQINIETLNSLKEIVLQNINSLCSKQQNQSENKLELKENKNLDSILKLISNKSNFCNQKYLESVKNELLKIQDNINMLKIEKDIYLNGKQQINFNELSFNQIENIEILCKQISELNNEYSNYQQLNQNDFLFAKLQPSSSLIIKNLAKLISKEKKYQIQEVLRNFPIFEMAQIIKQQPYQFELEITTLNSSNQNSKVAYDDDGYLKFEVVQQANCISYVKIKQDCQYKLIIKLDLINNHKNLFVGLVCQSHKDIKYVSDNNFINSFTPDSRLNDRGVSKIIKGKCLRDVKYPDEYTQIEITFCIKNKLFQVSDYPNNQNINVINDNRLNLIDLNKEYYLGFELFHINDSITILHFEEIQIQN